MEDVENPDFPILLGGDANKFHHDVLPHDFKNIKRTTNVEASMIKVSRNAMLAAKVAQSNMIYDMCEKWNADYSVIRNFLREEGTLGTTHFDVPGHDNKRGFGGKCLPKDTTHWESMFNEDNMYTMLLEYNETL
jgi:UDPglucose 6-dehydrogenase